MTSERSINYFHHFTDQLVKSRSHAIQAPPTTSYDLTWPSSSDVTHSVNVSSGVRSIRRSPHVVCHVTCPVARWPTWRTRARQSDVIIIVTDSNILLLPGRQKKNSTSTGGQVCVDISLGPSGQGRRHTSIDGLQQPLVESSRVESSRGSYNRSLARRRAPTDTASLYTRSASL